MAAKKPTFTVTVDEEFLAVLTSIKDSLDKLASGNVAVATLVSEVPEELRTEPLPITQPLSIPQTVEGAIESLKQQYDIPATQTPAQEPLQAPQGYVPPQSAPIQQPAPQIQPQPTQTLQIPGTPLQMPTGPAQPVQQTPVLTMPTTVPTYTLEQLMQASAQLMDKGQPPYDLLQKYGITMLTELNPENYGLFATDLRAKGAQI